MSLKRLFASISVCFTLTACGGKGGGNSSGDDEAVKLEASQGKSQEAEAQDAAATEVAPQEPEEGLVRPEEGPRVRYDDVFGAKQAKDRLQELVDAVRDGGRHAHLGVRPPRGIMLVGPPGSGKTMLARATAQEANLPIFVTTGTDLLDWQNGQNPTQRLRALIRAARDAAPSIVFIDEFDILALDPRMAKLLGTEMDGFAGASEVYFLAAANSLSGLPDSLLRAGRFDRIAPVPPPDAHAREQILRRVTRDTHQADDVNFAEVARLAEEKSGADLINLANVAALRAAHAKRAEVTFLDWEEGLVDLQLGTVDERYVTDEAQQWRTAVHEAGHALVALWIDGPLKLRRVTLVPRQGVLGHTSFEPTETTKSTWTWGDYLDVIAVGLAGHLAEERVWFNFGAGSNSDLRTVTQVARDMVTKFGMSESLRGAELSVIDNPWATQTLSEATHAAVDREVQDILAAQMKRVQELLQDEVRTLFHVANALEVRGTLRADEVAGLASGEISSEDIRYARPVQYGSDGRVKPPSTPSFGK